MVEQKEMLPLPEAPFDFDKDELLDVSVELCTDRLKGTVAWLVNCIQEQQQQLWSHEVRLGTIANTIGEGDEKSQASSRRRSDGEEKSRPSSRAKASEDAEEKSRPPSRVTIVEEAGNTLPTHESEAGSIESPKSVESPKTPGRKVRKSVTQALSDRMQDELLSMKVTKLEMELNTMPKAADLATHREELQAQIAASADKLNKDLQSAKDDIHSELAKLSEDMYSRLQRMCDDIIRRIEDVESITSRTDETNGELKVMINRIQVHLESQAAADSSVNVPMMPSENDSVAETAETLVHEESEAPRPPSTPPKSPPKSRESERRESNSRQSSGRPGEGDLPIPSESDPPTPDPKSINRPPSGRDHTNSVAYSDTACHYAAVNAVISDPSLFDATFQITDVKDRVDRNHQMCRKVEVQVGDLKENMAGLIEQNKEYADRIEALEAEINAMKQSVDSIEDPTAAVEAMRKEWLSKAACRGTAGDAGDSISPTRVKRKTTVDPPSPIVVGHIRPSSREGGANALAELHAEMDDIHAKLESMHPELEELRQAVSRMKSLEDMVSEHNEIILPMDQPDIGTTVSTFDRRMDDLESWKSQTDKRIRRMNPLDSEFADVQNELERLRKLFEFVQQVLPSDAAQAMSFFSKSFSQPASANGQKNAKITTKDIGSKKGKGVSPLIESVATSLGPEVAFEMQRAKLEDEVRHHEKAMRQEFANLTTAIKSLQREMQQTSGKTVDLVERVARVEGGSSIPATQEQPPQSATESATGGEASPKSSGRGSPPESRESLKPPQDRSGREEDLDGYVSKHAMQQALKDTREDFRNWLDEWSGNFVSALQKKADSNQVVLLLQELQQTVGPAGLTSDTMALIAKRALLGRCASCDANLNIEAENVKRNPPVPKPNGYPNRPPAGAPVSMRPPAGAASMPQVLLPKILDSRTGKDFPKSKVFKNPSAPDIRHLRMAEQSEETIQ